MESEGFLDSTDIHGVHSGIRSPGEGILGFFHPVNEASLPLMAEKNTRGLDAWLGSLS